MARWLGKCADMAWLAQLANLQEVKLKEVFGKKIKQLQDSWTWTYSILNYDQGDHPSESSCLIPSSPFLWRHAQCWSACADEHINSWKCKEGYTRVPACVLKLSLPMTLLSELAWRLVPWWLWLQVLLSDLQSREDATWRATSAQRQESPLN